ncbi:MAG TPA: 23S rRNA (adenine(2503)-C(2))-methyltransferase RlmN [Ruminiclostridium sp.]|jgi:23S rRNA (adenine2503-C2)-methyltransferase|uniref:Probable dual-specificity RNA methyltransferase RlmN n=1 Tax=Acetivibrio saccincola TaxID=1677857 RepID=A0A2K9E0P8_9FIRM|nr:23S rRNA (adenine(2503)-C(2))-methyltransferase RlmN [Acetivibrio saccincola]HAA43808.1 23S rRNA (adenine(2503)-C(2))-methyltransferase RlmN [Ruminiclostridium sp.]AUG57352.1 putative dual-specificity RNA methyltransferase RlmN [Acetivibrio saccincola]NLW27896.1 23S rRNA (adenine(2503)-C(2))-methyltransferase RlmN [Acetivibrio saccincola]PQQ67281.1 23S rRNA (adenine(2503)-C(2))-methyltransferase [Acetivibrio saccincola]HOA97694.1 23S rRNA (adenine(2503)-C(2))-methyltransferase RlmN [Acetivi
MEGKVDLMNMEIDELEGFVLSLGEPKFRARQIFEWVNKGVKDIDSMTNLSKDLRENLKRNAYINNFEIVKKLISKIDGTRKYIFKLYDNDVIESVLMKYSYGFSVCISSQAGCRMGCSFCASTGAGFKRNLTAGEMLDQVLTIKNDIKERIGNIVIMGIGEPFDNYDNLIKFLRLVNHKDGLNIGFRYITVSTCGLVPQILKFSKENMPVTLSVSLHAPDDETRSKIMPVNNKYPLDKLVEACKIYTMITNRRITFEYSLINGINDSSGHAEKLVSLIKGMLCHVNLIPVNTVSNTGYKRSSRESIEMFKNILEKHGIKVTIRRGLGRDIDAACGQLRRNIIN